MMDYWDQPLFSTLKMFHVLSVCKSRAQMVVGERKRLARRVACDTRMPSQLFHPLLAAIQAVEIQTVIVEPLDM